jgi:hypothetical protein
MPTYDYHCETNGRTLEVSHRMSETLHTWGELCTKAGVEPGDTPLDTPVSRMATGGSFIGSGSGGSSMPSMPSGGGCGGGMCGCR